MKKAFLIFICFISVFLFHTKLIAQNDTLKFNGKSSLLLDIYGPEVIGIYFNYYINNRISVNTGLGIFLDFHLGTNVYLIRRNKSRHAIYIGGQIAHYRTIPVSFGWGDPHEPDSQFGIYFPIGYEYCAKKNFTLQIDLGPNIVSEENWGQTNTYPLMFSIKIGKTFNLSKHNK